ncbi:MAG: hypothetical protein AAFY88_23720, partial [Acidobacteriota bacterium]
NRAILMAALERVFEEMDDDTRTRLEPLPMKRAEDAVEVSRLSTGVDDGGPGGAPPVDVC